MNFTKLYLEETTHILDSIDCGQIETVATHLGSIRRRRGRLFILGVGGSAATASHAVNDFRKIARLEAYAPTDNVAELTARTNDNGWESTFVDWLGVSKIGGSDGVLVLSVGGGNDHTSQNIVNALDFANARGATTMGIVGRDGGHTLQYATHSILIPPVYKDRITPHTEGIASVILHLLVSHPSL